MFIAINERNGQKISARRAVTEDSAFFCPCCTEDVILRNGSIRVPHFAHLKRTHCDRFYQSDNVMSKWHREWQEQFPEECRETVFERNGEKHIADVFFNDYVIEFQHSPLSADIFIERTEFYVLCGKKVIWLFDFRDDCEQEKLYPYTSIHFDPDVVDCDFYVSQKWAWRHPKRTFQYFQANSKYWKNHVYLMFQDENEYIR